MGQRIKINKINDHIWLLNDNDEATGYLVTGTKKALVIDTMNGYENVRALVETLTELPIMLVNTHGHSDHIYGNIYFEEAYIHPADMELAERYYQHPMFQKAIAEAGLKPAIFKPIVEGEVIDLGGIELEVFEVPGHTPGGIVLLDRKDRIMFTGDSVIEQTWMQMQESLPMEVFLKSLGKIQGLRDEFDFVLTGHSRHMEDASLCEAHYKAVQEVCNGETQNDEPYTWYGGTCMAHPYGPQPRRIVYNP